MVKQNTSNIPIQVQVLDKIRFKCRMIIGLEGFINNTIASFVGQILYLNE
jgi:hypothetical protein